jgi:hypothetical protein
VCLELYSEVFCDTVYESAHVFEPLPSFLRGAVPLTGESFGAGVTQGYEIIVRIFVRVFLVFQKVSLLIGDFGGRDADDLPAFSFQTLDDVRDIVLGIFL